MYLDFSVNRKDLISIKKIQVYFFFKKFKKKKKKKKKIYTGYFKQLGVPFLVLAFFFFVFKNEKNFRHSNKDKKKS